MKIDGDCPHCKEKVSIDIDKLEVKQPKPLDNPSSTLAQTQQQVMQEPEVKEIIKEVVKLPTTQPNYKCKDGRCGNIHPNPDYKEAPTKKCQNCGQFSNSDTCVWCNGKEFDDLESEDLEDLGIPLPQISHEGHEHE